MRNDILFGILLTLLREGKKTYNYLAEKFEVSKRTIQRYCLTLEMAGVPTICTFGRTGGIEILGNYNLSNMFFTKQELNRIRTHLHASPLSELDNIDKQIEEKLDFQSGSKIPNSNSSFIVDYTAWSEELKLNPIIKLLNSNLNMRKCYEIEYINSNGVLSTRTISPYKFILKDSKWYLFAYCHKRKETRVFKINRIQGLKVTDAEYKENEMTDNEIKEHLNNLFEQIEITVEVATTIIPDTLEWINDTKITYTDSDTAIITGTTTKSYDLISKIITCSTKLKLLAPESLLNEVRTATKNLNKLYIN